MRERYQRYLLLASFLAAVLLAGRVAEGLDFSLEEVRSMGMGGARRSSALSTSGLLLNPGGIAMSKLYHVEASYQYNHLYESHLVGGSVVDSITSLLGVGLGYFYRRVERSDAKMQVHDARLSLSLPVSRFAGVGLTAKYLRSANEMQLGEAESPPYGRELNSFSLDAGLQVRLGKHFGLGVVGYNLTNLDTPVAPLSLAMSVSGLFGNFQAIFDAILDWSSYEELEAKYMAGVEYFFMGHVPIRGGYSYNAGEETHSIHGGIGYISETASVEAALSGNINEGLVGRRGVRLLISVKYFLN